MRSHTVRIVCALALASCATPRTAPDQPWVPSSPQSDEASASGTRPLPHPRRTGRWELAAGGAGGSNDDLSAGSGQAAASGGYYLNDCVEVLLRQNGSYSDPGNGQSDSWAAASRAAIDFHLPLGNFVPYAGINCGYAYGDAIRDSMIAGPEAGLKLYVKDEVFVLLAGEYRFAFTHDDSFRSAFDDGQLVYGISLGVRF